MHGALDLVVFWPQESREIVLPLRFTMPSKTTVQLASMLAMITNQTCDVHYARSVYSQKCKEDLRFNFMLKGTVPDPKAFMLKCNEMVKPRQQERIQVFGIVGPRYNASNEDVLFLVALRRI